MNKENTSKLWEIIKYRKSLELITAVYETLRQYRNIKVPIDKNNSLYHS